MKTDNNWIDGFKNRLNDSINERNVSPTKFARDAGIKEETLRTWLKKDQVPGADSIVKICDFWGISIDWLLTGKDNNISQEEWDMLQGLRNLDELDRRGLFIEINKAFNETQKDKEIKKDKRRLETIKKAYSAVNKLASSE
ncbi:MAG: helix-turn-helix domain-containing protein [Candidatus Marinimicrobia bacterium]|nr:helix-turn-helix domain-containing protein [Candidatus Neomarinimicrobiota bacterium]